MLSEGKRDETQSVTVTALAPLCLPSLLFSISPGWLAGVGGTNAGISDAGRAKPFPGFLTSILVLWGVLKGPLWLPALALPFPFPTRLRLDLQALRLGCLRITAA